LGAQAATGPLLRRLPAAADVNGSSPKAASIAEIARKSEGCLPRGA